MQLGIDIDDALRFLALLDPQLDAFCFQALDDVRLPTGKPRDDSKLRQTLFGDIREHAPHLQRLNTKFGAAIYVVINKTDGRGRLATNIVKIRALWTDLDRGLPQRWFIPPSIIVQTSPGKYQAYWLIDGELSHADALGILKHLQLSYGGDPGVNTLERILRVPGFWHQKGEPFRVTMLDANGRRYSVSEITAHHPPMQEQRQAQPVPEEIPETERNRTLISFAGRMRRAGASPEEIEATLLVMNEQRCKPPLDPKEIHKIANSAGRYAPGALVKEGAINWPEIDKDGVPFSRSVGNVAAYLNHLGAVPWHNDFDGKYYIDGLEGHTELDDKALRAMRILAESYQFRVPKDAWDDYLLDLAYQDRRHPVREYLLSVKWDGIPRLKRWLTDYVGCTEEDPAYVETVGQLILCAAVERVRRPGCKFDYMAVLEGPQDQGKSSVWRILAGDEWFSESLPIGAEPKIVIEQTKGKWIIEHPELDGIERRDVEPVKAFITRQEDGARAAYARQTATVRRQFILTGTTNNADYLRDDTGNRRFLCLKAGRIDMAALRRDRDQLWAEAVELCDQWPGMRLDLPAEVKPLAADAQAKRLLPDPIEDKLLPLLPRFSCFIPTQELMCALGVTDIDRQRRNNRPLGRVMQRLGWGSMKRRDKGKSLNGYYKGGRDAVLFLWNAASSEFVPDPDSDAAKLLR